MNGINIEANIKIRVFDLIIAGLEK